MPIWMPRPSAGPLIGRQLVIEEQVMRQNTWTNPQDRYRPVRPESFGPITPRAYGGPTLADVYAYLPGKAVYDGVAAATAAPAEGRPARLASNDRPGYFAAPVPVFQPWPRVPGDIWGTPYYGYVRQPIGYVKIWTGRLSYIYKPIYASPPAASPHPAVGSAPRAAVPPPPRPAMEDTTPGKIPPPPPAPAIPLPGPNTTNPRDRNGSDGSRAGQEI